MTLPPELLQQWGSRFPNGFRHFRVRVVLPGWLGLSSGTAGQWVSASIRKAASEVGVIIAIMEYRSANCKVVYVDSIMLFLLILTPPEVSG
jgi:hypothetical protein